MAVLNWLKCLWLGHVWEVIPGFDFFSKDKPLFVCKRCGKREGLK